jgi:hypothetical protein
MAASRITDYLDKAQACEDVARSVREPPLAELYRDLALQWRWLARVVARDAAPLPRGIGWTHEPRRHRPDA